MKTCISFLMFFSFIANFTHAQNTNKWKLTWSEEFNYSGLPDSSIWRYEVGHVRNNEQQYYTRAKIKNVEVSNGMLTITGLKEYHSNENYRHGITDWRYKDSLASYTSASINTLGSTVKIPVGQSNGRIEIRARMPRGAGMWPALWLMGANRPEVGWPKCGEIDLMEFIGNHPHDIYGTVHYPTQDKKHHSSGGKIIDTTLCNQFHIYALEWDNAKMDFYFDDYKYHTFIIDSATLGNENPFRKNFYLLINMAMGAGWPGSIDDNVLPQKFEVDYVRIFKKK
ncbi:MAG: glycoside hydrolase family 16 protein [Ginsengibacter sp.]